jgi:hypothetical protein
MKEKYSHVGYNYKSCSVCVRQGTRTHTQAKKTTHMQAKREQKKTFKTINTKIKHKCSYSIDNELTILYKFHVI